ncbi:MAG: phosphoribosylformylglycinamidine synthase [Clostridiales Family XIII bacterium]|nr:phosphoribosylformylglycinamidine synthase [Clostridiales Family XIII bacterium]
MVRRIYVEKKEGFDTEARALCATLSENLHIAGVARLRVLNRYDIENIDDATYETAKRNVFSEPAVDIVFEEAAPLGDAFVFGVEYLPGQYDQRADSAVRCIRLIKPDARPAVRFARVIAVEGALSESEIESVKRFVINPVDSREASSEKPATLALRLETPPPVPVIDGFIAFSEDEAEAFRRRGGYAMSPADMLFTQTYFRDTERRDPTLAELKVIDTYWSDHCRHTTFNTKLERIDFGEGPYAALVRAAFDKYLRLRGEAPGENPRAVSLMDIAVICARYLKGRGLIPDLDESEEVNACSIRVKADVNGAEEDWLVMFKNETHNHPTEIEPFGGAATCLGGAIRDPLSGRAYVYQAMRVTGSGDPRAELRDTLPGKLPQLQITRGAAKGYSSYGNQVGLSTGQVVEIYHEGYVAKRMEIGAVIGAAPAAQVRRETPAPGDAILLVGGGTGRDGCGGATGSSKEHTAESLTACGAEVQKGNPPIERDIQRLFRRGEAALLIKRCNDFGAGGVSVAVGELAGGTDVDLDRIPKKYEGLDGVELAISESQERMAVVVAKEDAARFIALAEEENLEAAVIARVTDTGRFRMYHRGETILDLRRDFLDTEGVRQSAEVFVADRDFAAGFAADETRDLAACLDDLNCCDLRGLAECFDSTIGAGTVLMPFGGFWQATPALGMAAKLPLYLGETRTTTLMTFGFDPLLSAASPFHGALYAVVDSVTKIVAMGGDRRTVRLTFQEYFEKLGRDPARWAKPFSALLGALEAQLALEIPAIGGKDSMSGSFSDLDVPPTLVSFAVIVTRAERVLSPEFKKPGSRLVFVDAERDDAMLLDFAQYRRNTDRVTELAAEGKILSASVAGRGGVFAAVVKMAAGNRIGASLKNLTDAELRAPRYGALILEIDAEIDAGALLAGARFKEIGLTTARAKIRVSPPADTGGPAFAAELDALLRRWEAPLAGVFSRESAEQRAKTLETVRYAHRAKVRPTVRTAKPRVLIPVFPGTNCEADSRRAFEDAGALVTLRVLQNRTPAALTTSIRELARGIGESQIVMIPGGFSGGDEPDGSAKFIAAVFKNPAVREAVAEFLERRGGLMLGICNGFQALVKLGLLPFGEIRDGADDSPTLACNSIGRHVSRLVRTRVASTLSPWLAGASVGDLHTVPVSHGEGRFTAPAALLRAMAEDGRIATQYADAEGNPTSDFRFNPNNSDMAIEGISSPDGRILGKMGHTERIGPYLYRNVPGNFDRRIFASGVAYFA